MLVSRTRASGLVLLASTLAAGAASAGEFKWDVVVNNGTPVPGDAAGRNFNSYNQPSLNAKGLVVFRARSKGGDGGQPAHGVYTRDMSRNRQPIVVAFDRNTLVPQPNNLGSTFIEPPSFPRIDIATDTFASRAVHPPVWEYVINTEGDTTKVGTTGVYVNLMGSLLTGASGLGAAPGWWMFAVPETILSDDAPIKFDMFPGAPAVDGTTIVVKGNFTDESGTGRTGIYYRDLTPELAGGTAPMVVVADNLETVIPGTVTVFGSTAPPSAVGGVVVFAGFDNEDAPALGGIYMAARTGPRPALVPLVEIGGQVPGEATGTGFTRLGEGLSYDGRYVGFWGAWRTEETRQLLLTCPTDGNKDRIAYCQELYPDGFLTTVPVHQGIFVIDTWAAGFPVQAVAKAPGDFDDFVYWNFSGRVPGTGGGEEGEEEEGELARWRSASFAAVSGMVGKKPGGAVQAAFKARRTGSYNETLQTYVNPIDGIYLGKFGTPGYATVVETGMPGTDFDKDAFYVDEEDPKAKPVALPVTTMGIERDGFRGNLLAITVSMATEEAGWAGIYVTKVKK